MKIYSPEPEIEEVEDAATLLLSDQLMEDDDESRNLRNGRREFRRRNTKMIDEIILNFTNWNIPMKWIPLTLMKLKLKDPPSI